MRLILASGSPRRKEILAAAGYLFDIIPSGADEKAERMPPDQLVLRLSAAKAESVGAEQSDAVVIGADTVVYIDGKILGKPSGPEEAARMLEKLSGREHTVYTGVSIQSKERRDGFFCRTLVRFRHLSEDAIRRYIATGESLDKAGAYGIQGRGALLVEKIDGDYFNVMGLPVSELAWRLEKHYGVIPS